MENTIQNKVIVVTGASSGLGKALVEQLAGKGAKLVIGARRVDELAALADSLRDSTGQVRYQATEVSDKQQVQALVDFALAEFGQIDVLVNNAAIMPSSFLVKNDTDEWDRLIDINIKGVLYGIGAVLSHMRERNSGHIINVSSTAAHEDISPFTTVYSMTKHAVRNITEGLRKEEGMVGSKIRVTEMAPGGIDTDLKKTVTDPGMKEAVMTAYEDKSQLLSAEDMARAIVYAINEPENIAVNSIVVRPTGAH